MLELGNVDGAFIALPEPVPEAWGVRIVKVDVVSALLDLLIVVSSEKLLELLNHLLLYLLELGHQTI